MASTENASTQPLLGSRWICSDANRFTGSSAVTSSQVIVPHPFGRSTVAPGVSSRESAAVSPPVCWVSPSTSSVYTDLGVPSSMPRSPLNTLRVSTGLTTSG